MFSTCTILIIFVSLFSCKKDSKKDSCELSMTSLSGDYQMISLISKTSNGEIIDVFADADECVKDNMWTFAPNGFIYIKDIGILCDGFNANVETWSIVGDELHFSSLLTGFGGKANITSFDCDQFSYQSEETTNDGTTYLTTVSFKRY